jgi:hypothetical protein
VRIEYVYPPRCVREENKPDVNPVAVVRTRNSWNGIGSEYCPKIDESNSNVPANSVVPLVERRNLISLGRQKFDKMKLVEPVGV